MCGVGLLTTLLRNGRGCRGRIDPHRYDTRHAKLHSIARIIRDRYDGDARKIWTGRTASSILTILEDELKVGPAIARMTIGALRDHRLLKTNRSDFKPDRYVIRLMNALGLANSTRAVDVIEAGRRNFPNPWLADACLYQLGSDYNVETRRQFLTIYDAAIHWKRVHRPLKDKFKALVRKASDQLGNGRWEIYPEHSYHWAGAYLVRKTGPLARPMNQEGSGGLWLWIGMGFDGVLSVGLDIGGNEKFFDSNIRKRLRRAGLEAVRQGPDVAKGAVEFSGTWRVNPMALKSSSELVKLLKKAVGVCNRMVDELEPPNSRIGRIS